MRLHHGWLAVGSRLRLRRRPSSISMGAGIGGADLRRVQKSPTREQRECKKTLIFSLPAQPATARFRRAAKPSHHQKIMNNQKPPRPLDGILFAALIAEFLTLWIFVYSPSDHLGQEDNSSFAHFWARLWWLLTAYWVAAIVLSLLNRKNAHLHYAASWVAFFLYGFLSRQEPVLSSSMSILMGSLNIFLGGVCLTLLLLRHHSIGFWLQHSVLAHFRRKQTAEPPSETQPMM
jgi:hypothetical protein